MLGHLQVLALLMRNMQVFDNLNSLLLLLLALQCLFSRHISNLNTICIRWPLITSSRIKPCITSIAIGSSVIMILQSWSSRYSIWLCRCCCIMRSRITKLWSSFEASIYFVCVDASIDRRLRTIIRKRLVFLVFLHGGVWTCEATRFRRGLLLNSNHC